MSYWQSSASSEDHHGCDQDHQPCPHFIIRWAPGRGAGSLTSGTIHTFNCFSFKHDHHCLDLDWRVELQTNVCEHFTIMEKVPTLLAQWQYCTSYCMIYFLYEVNCCFLSILLHKYLILCFFTSYSREIIIQKKFWSHPEAKWIGYWLFL